MTCLYNSKYKALLRGVKLGTGNWKATLCVHGLENLTAINDNVTQNDQRIWNNPSSLIAFQNHKQ